MTVLLRTRAELASWLAATRGPRGVVLTMGALHAGHMALVSAARAAVPGGTVLVTVFVNPAQFGPQEDFSRYPRMLESDLDLCSAHGVDAVFAPDVAEVYPAGEHVVEYDLGELADDLEGRSRPGHFAGVAKVVSRLLRLTAADVTCFGEKDYQQLTLVRRLNQLEPALAHVEFIGVPIVRDADGLALSSRNRYLTDEERQRALAIPRCIAQVQQACRAGLPVEAALLEGLTTLQATAGIDVDYLTIRGVDLGPASTRGEARVLVAARVGSTRLIDNAPVVLGGAT